MTSNDTNTTSSRKRADRRAAEDLVHGKENQDSAHRQQASGGGGGDDPAADKACFGCKRSLSKAPQLINIAGQAHIYWHPECFKCQVCQQPLDKLDSCHIYKEKILCRDDYLKLRRPTLVGGPDHQGPGAIRCPRCRWQIGSSDWVRRAGQYVYHLTCFNCDICARQLNTGEQFAIDVQERGRCVRLLCQLHFSVELRQQQQQQPPPPSAIGQGDTQAPAAATTSAHQATNDQLLYGHDSHQGVIKSPAIHEQQQQQQQFLHLLGPPPTSSDHHENPDMIEAKQGLAVEASQLDQQQQQQLPTMIMPPIGQQDLLSAATTTTTLQQLPRPSSVSSTSTNAAHHQPMITNSNGGGSGGGSKSKRVRTTFTEDQLSILQNHFHIDSNPDGQDLERIATITGLSKRVTQVWFQNSRARQKKYMIKRKPGSGSLGGGGGGGAGVMSSSTQATATTTSMIAAAVGLVNTNSNHHHHHHQHQAASSSRFQSGILDGGPPGKSLSSVGYDQHLQQDGGGGKQVQWSGGTMDEQFDTTESNTDDSQSSYGADQLIVSEDDDDDGDEGDGSFARSDANEDTDH